MRWSRYRRRSTWPVPPSQTCGAGFTAGTVGCEGDRIGLAPAVVGKSFECDFPASLAAALQTFAIASRPNGFVVQDRHRPRWFFPPSEPQCSTRKGSRLVQATNRWTPQCSMDASSRDKRAVLKQLVIIQGINLGVAPARRATPPSRRQTSATKRVYRTAIE